VIDDKVKDIFGWDVVNWSQSILYWENFISQKDIDNITALELGSGFNGGLSLWLASKGIKTTCSGYSLNYRGAWNEAKSVHHKYGISDLIEYKEVDATNIPYKSKYDIICYKSMLGGIVREKTIDTAKKVIEEIYAALKPGGMLLFAENISSTFVHKIMRNKYGAGKNKWRYFTIEEFEMLHREFQLFEYRTFGFFGAFGLNEKLRTILGNIDQVILKIVPKKWNYILTGVAVKQNNV